MTEQEWLACGDPQLKLAYLSGKASDRKLRLFSVACCRSVRTNLWGEPSYSAIAVAERFADHIAAPEELSIAQLAIADHLELYPGEPVYCPTFYACEDDMGEDASSCAFYAANNATKDCPSPDMDDQAMQVRAREVLFQLHLLTELFGNPFASVALDPACVTPTVTSLATAAYEARGLPSGEMAPDRLAVLSDALEESGCDDATILDHLRSPGPHVRGCWALDLILGKH